MARRENRAFELRKTNFIKRGPFVCTRRGPQIIVSERSGLMFTRRRRVRSDAPFSMPKVEGRQCVCRIIGQTGENVSESGLRVDVIQFAGVFTLLTRAHKKFHPFDSSCGNGFAPRGHRRRSEGPVRSR